MSRSAATRKFRKDFDATPYYALVDGKPIGEAVGMCRLRDGRVASFHASKPGKVSVMAWTHKDTDAPGARAARRTFGVKEHDAIREWVLNGGTIEAEERAKRIRAHAFELYGALKDLVSVIDALGTQGGAKMERARAAIAKAEGK